MQFLHEILSDKQKKLEQTKIFYEFMCGCTKYKEESGMKKLVSMLLVMLLVLGVFGATAESQFKGQIKIGVSCAMTGDVPLEGERVKQTVSMAFEECNAAGGIDGYELVAIFEDDANNSNTAVNVVNKFGSDESIIAMIGPHRSTNIAATQDIIKRYKIPTLSGGTSVSYYTYKEEGNDYIFRTRPSDSAVPILTIKFAHETLGCTKYAILYDNDDYGNGARGVMEEFFASDEAKTMGIEAVAMQGFNTGDKDMYAQLLAAQEAGADVIIGWCHDAEAAIITRGFKELGLDESMKLVGCSSWANTAFYDLLDASLPVGTYATIDYIAVNPEPFAAEFCKKFVDKYGVEPENMAGCYYDAALILIDSLKRAAETGEITRESVKDALTVQPEIEGNQGTLYADGIDMIHCTNFIENTADGVVYIARASL